MIRAGTHRHHILLERREATPGTMGDLSDQWNAYAERGASIATLSGVELERARLLDPRVTHRVEMRYCGDLRPEHRIKFGTRVFHVRAVMDPDEKRWLHVALCDERTNA